MSTIAESLERLENYVSAIDSIIATSRQGNCSLSALKDLQNSSAEVANFINEERRKTAPPWNENIVGIDEQSRKLQLAMTLFDLRIGMSTHDLVSEMKNGMSTQVRAQDYQISQAHENYYVLILPSTRIKVPR